MKVIDETQVFAILKQYPDISHRVDRATTRIRGRFGEDVAMTLATQIVPETGDCKLVLFVQRPTYSREESRFLGEMEAEFGDFLTEFSVSLVFSEVRRAA